MVCSRVAVDVSVACNVLITIVRVWLVSGGHYSAVLKEFDIDQFYTIAVSRGSYSYNYCNITL